MGEVGCGAMFTLVPHFNPHPRAKCYIYNIHILVHQKWICTSNQLEPIYSNYHYIFLVYFISKLNPSMIIIFNVLEDMAIHGNNYDARVSRLDYFQTIFHEIDYILVIVGLL